MWKLHEITDTCRKLPELCYDRKISVLFIITNSVHFFIRNTSIFYQ